MGYDGGTSSHGSPRCPTMSTEFGPAHPAEVIPVRPKQKPEAAPQRKQLPPFVVILHNDEINTFEFVVGVLQRVFKYPVEKAYQLTEEAHVRGRSVVWS